MMEVIFGAVWGSYDRVFKKSFGDGERTIDDDDDDVDEEKRVGMRWGGGGDIQLGNEEKR